MPEGRAQRIEAEHPRSEDEVRADLNAELERFSDLLRQKEERPDDEELKRTIESERERLKALTSELPPPAEEKDERALDQALDEAYQRGSENVEREKSATVHAKDDAMLEHMRRYAENPKYEAEEEEQRQIEASLDATLPSRPSSTPRGKEVRIDIRPDDREPDEEAIEREKENVVETLGAIDFLVDDVVNVTAEMSDRRQQRAWRSEAGGIATEAWEDALETTRQEEPEALIDLDRWPRVDIELVRRLRARLDQRFDRLTLLDRKVRRELGFSDPDEQTDTDI